MRNFFTHAGKHLKLQALLLALMLCLCACADAPEAAAPIPTAAPAPMPTPAPTPQPTPAFPDAAAAAGMYEELWRAQHAFSLSGLVPENVFDTEKPWQIFGTTLEARQWLPALEAAFAVQMEESLERAREALAAALGCEVELEAETEPPVWQFLFALMQGCASEAEAEGHMQSALALNVEEAVSDGAGLRLRVHLAPKAYAEAFADEDEALFLRRCFSYSYNYTVFGSDGTETEFVQPEAEGSLAAGIRWPLASHTRLRKSWYADRSGGIRKHTGTDIWADADTEVYSCTDGVISYVGYGEGTGNAVIVTDPYGYAFHYYHFIRLPDFVKKGDTVQAGDLIGHVGNTGNSDLDHLHLSIVAPDGKYVNPYPYLLAVEP